ncbi:hypothetical protein [Flavobacterium ajazii]|uniref:hypothetical protein n=1 Tax=Flavobacterium ajazii TaxID=2692318 RepID=UPI0013D2FE44|nr:hypothetical protein [Flavobacterium ajazii]
MCISLKHRTGLFSYFCSCQRYSTDYLLSGIIQTKQNNIQDMELLLQFGKVKKLLDNKKYLDKEFLDAFILKANLQQQFS